MTAAVVAALNRRHVAAAAGPAQTAPATAARIVWGCRGGSCPWSPARAAACMSKRDWCEEGGEGAQARAVSSSKAAEKSCQQAKMRRRPAKGQPGTRKETQKTVRQTHLQLNKQIVKLTRGHGANRAHDELCGVWRRWQLVGKRIFWDGVLRRSRRLMKLRRALLHVRRVLHRRRSRLTHLCRRRSTAAPAAPSAFARIG